MRLKQARELCPGFIRVPARPERYAEVSTRNHARAAGYHAGCGGVLGGRGVSRHHALPGLLEQIP